LGRGKTFAAFSAITAMESLLETYCCEEYSIDTGNGSWTLTGDCPCAKAISIINHDKKVSRIMVLAFFTVFAASF
jgi:hypothetical protein